MSESERSIQRVFIESRKIQPKAIKEELLSARLVALVKSANRAGLVVLDKLAYCRPPVED